MIRFRVDDYPGTKPQEFYRHNLENFKRFHEVMERHGRTYVLGVIPKHTSDEDLRWLGSQKGIEVAMHGVNHDERFPNEFRDYQSEREVAAILQNEKGILEQETGHAVWAYIPPHNVIDRKTVNALLTAGFKELHVGPGTTFDMCMYASERMSTFPSFPPYYGRSDEFYQQKAHATILREAKERENPFSSKGVLTIGLHWTWEWNIGLEHLDRFLSEIKDARQ